MFVDGVVCVCVCGGGEPMTHVSRSVGDPGGNIDKAFTLYVRCLC